MLRSGLLLATLTACGRIGFSLTDEVADAELGDGPSDGANVPAGAIIAFHFDENTGTTTTSTGTMLVGTLNDTGWTAGVRGSAIAPVASSIFR